MGPQPRKQFALDTNVLLDLAEGEGFAHAFLEAALERGCFLFVTPTVVQELDYFRRHPELDRPLAHLALRALSGMLDWKITPYDLKAVGHGITEQFALFLIGKGFLREGEINDGQILAETSLARIPALVTSDSDILDIDPGWLASAFIDRGLDPVNALRPQTVTRGLRGDIKKRARA